MFRLTRDQKKEWERKKCKVIFTNFHQVDETKERKKAKKDKDGDAVVVGDDDDDVYERIERKKEEKKVTGSWWTENDLKKLSDQWTSICF